MDVIESCTLNITSSTKPLEEGNYSVQFTSNTGMC